MVRLTRRRPVVAAGVLVALCAIAALAILSATGEGQPSDDSRSAALAVIARAQRGEGPAVIFRSASHGDRIGVARLEDAPRRPRYVRERCARVYFAGGRGLCLTRRPGSNDASRAEILDADLRVTGHVDVPGVPSRARVSPDGRYGSVTLFVTGHSYAAEGQLSTETILIDLARGTQLAELEDFTVARGGRQVTAVDRNFWGVTFADDSDRFYATMATGGRTFLIQGSVREHTARTIRSNVECPSLSPDGTRIAFKRRVSSGDDPWRLAVLDLRTMRETPLAEPRSIDDQAEWVDDDNVAYGRGGDTWVVPADGTGSPRRLITGGDSPAVVR